MHIPVLLKELVHYLDPKPGDTILDATIDGGGHAKDILKAIGDEGRLIGIEQDAEILEQLELRIKNQELRNVILINGNFRDLDELLAPYNIKKTDGIIFDLGLSSLQLEESGRGFSFQRDEPLAMTFKSDISPSDLTARDIVNKWSEEDIAEILKKYGEERHSRKIAKNIAEHRQRKDIRTTSELVNAIATKDMKRLARVFQALRIAVNDELNALNEGINKAWDILSIGGRLVIISFHSLEDRVVKNFFREEERKGEGKILTKKPVGPSAEEKKENPRARSAKLRAIEKL